MTDTTVRGLSDLQKLLDTLPAKIEKNVLRGALRAGAKPVLAEAKQNALQATNTMRDGLKITTSGRGSAVTASIKATGRHAHLAIFQEYGTESHRISAKDGGKLAIGGAFFDFVEHPGQQAKPFMRPALDSQAGTALIAAGEYIKKRLAGKHGLDTSEIIIGDDE